ncbi:DEAD/DEAH box helicase family protein [Corynebacterium striatum]
MQLSEAEAAQLALERELAEQAREKAAAQETADDALREAREARERVKHLEAELRERYLEQQEAVRASEEASAVDLPPLARSEADTRRDIIDPMLADAGFSVAGGNLTVEYPIEDLYIDYVAWGTDGQPLAIIEAKKTERSINDGRVQAEDYAEALGRKFGRVPLVFYTNGHDVRFWDRDAELPGGYCYEARQVEEYPTAAAMEELIRRRGKRQPLETTELSDIAARPYQQQMLRAVSERFAAGHRRALLVMATGTGKTRVSISLVKMLMEAGWVRNVLFLADRKALVRQAHSAFVEHLPGSNPVNLLANKEATGQVYVSTYNTMIDMVGPTERFGSFDFDLIVVDEAHRSIYQRYRRLFEYFDAAVVGLTATPRSNVDHNTYRFFGCEPGAPTGYYGLDKAIEDGYLVAPKLFRGDSLFMRQGVKYSELSSEEQLEWDMKDWGSDESGDPLEAPGEITSAEMNRVLYNLDTIRQVLAQVIERGIKVGGADRLGKTIIFARTQRHAELIAEVFRTLLPPAAGTRCEDITHGVKDAEGLIDRFKDPASGLDVAVSVDMLDTGIDVPEVLNLVFFKPVHSPVKFWQMVGRGTRLCPDLFGPGADKQEFFIFDYCDNIDQFEGTEDFSSATGSKQTSVVERGFAKRILQLQYLEGEDRAAVVESLLADLRSVPEDSVLVPPASKPYLARYKVSGAWNGIRGDAASLAIDHLAHLPMARAGEEEQARRFDLLLWTLELGLFEPDPRQVPNFKKLAVLVEALLDKTTIPAVAQQAPLLEEMSAPDWSTNATYEELELARRALRGLIKTIDRGKRKAVITDFEDELGGLTAVEVTATGGTEIEASVVEERLRQALEAEAATNLSLRKLRSGKPINTYDVDELERLVAESHVEGAEQLRESHIEESIGRFLRGIVGMDEPAVRAEFDAILADTTLNSVQIQFVDLLVGYIARNGVLDVDLG